MPTAFESIRTWITRARAKLESEVIGEADLDELEQILNECRDEKRQRLLYLQTVTPGVQSQVIGMALHEPIGDSTVEIMVDGQEWPYQTVHDAIVDGWQVIHFPEQQLSSDEGELGMLGCEFILQKQEIYHE